MINYKYKVTQLISDPTNTFQVVGAQERRLIDTFPLNTFFNQFKHRVEYNIYTLEGSLLLTDREYDSTYQLTNAAGAGREGAQEIRLDPVEDIKRYGYEAGDVLTVYHFLNNLFSEGIAGGSFFIESISNDRTELRALSNVLPGSDIKRYVERIKNSLNSLAHFSEFYLNFGEGTIVTALNVESEDLEKGTSIVLKLYKPLPNSITVNSVFEVEEKVLDSAVFQIDSEIVQEVPKTNFLRGPNFDIDSTYDNRNPTEYLDLNELFGYPVSGSFYKLYSLAEEKGVELSIDYTDFSNFTYFSSAEERIRNFKYKLELIQGYESERSLKSGSVEYYDTLIKGIVSNFDHYDRYLYYESGSYAWPKSNTTPPYLNKASDDPESVQWFEEIVEQASNYDIANDSILIGDVPFFLREDETNAPYIAFIYMLGQYFDNIWIYAKAITERYNADNRVNVGVSKDLIREVIESLGVKLYNSNFNTTSLFSSYIGESPSDSEEIINENVVITEGTSLHFLQPVPFADYEKEVYKRIYHNLPHLLKTKGTERGLRALINCFGIPDDILNIYTFGGTPTESLFNYGPLSNPLTSLDKIRIEESGSTPKDNILSQYISTVPKSTTYSDDQNLIEVGFNLSDSTDRYVRSKIEVTDDSFNIDNIIGDPRLRYASQYDSLKQKSATVLQNGSYLPEDPSLSFSKDPKALIRLVRFFDSRVFRMIKDFTPVRSNLTTGIIVKDHILHRSKAKQVELSIEEKIHTGSVEIANISGSDGNSFPLENQFPYTLNYEQDVQTLVGLISRDITDESPRYNGELSGSILEVTNGNLTEANPFLKNAQPVMSFRMTTYSLSPALPPDCILEVILALIDIDIDCTLTVTCQVL